MQASSHLVPIRKTAIAYMPDVLRPFLFAPKTRENAILPENTCSPSMQSHHTKRPLDRPKKMLESCVVSLCCQRGRLLNRPLRMLRHAKTGQHAVRLRTKGVKRNYILSRDSTYSHRSDGPSAAPNGPYSYTAPAASSAAGCPQSRPSRAPSCRPAGVLPRRSYSACSCSPTAPPGASGARGRRGVRLGWR